MRKGKSPVTSFVLISAAVVTVGREGPYVTYFNCFWATRYFPVVHLSDACRSCFSRNSKKGAHNAQFELT